MGRNNNNITIDAAEYIREGEKIGRVLSADHELRQPRRIGSALSVLVVIINILIGISPVYFIFFGLVVYGQNGRPADIAMNQNLLEASLYGTTIFPVIFAAVVGKSLKSIAEFLLERGSTIATIEYILASRTVSGVLIAPFRFRVMRIVVLPLILLWALSPLGSQASLRVISTTMQYSNTSQIVTYLDVNGSDSYTSGGNGQTFFSNAINSAYNAALLSPAAAKDASQDIYGHVKIPMIEALMETASSRADRDGWLSIGALDYNVSTYSSLVGLPLSGIAPSGNTTFAVETSYFALDCSLNGTQLNNVTGLVQQWQSANPLTSGIAWNGGQMSMTYDVTHYNGTSQPRNIGLWSLSRSDQTLSIASCALTTTYVEARVSCTSGRCSAIAVRNSTLTQLPKTWSVLDLEGNSAVNTFIYLVNTTAKPHIATSSPMEFYLNDPRTPTDSTSEVVLAKVDPTAFSQRLAQLINSYWMISLTPDAALGRDFTDGITRATTAKTVLGYVLTDARVLHCDRAWLAVLLISSCIMLFAGVLTTILDARRKGPDVLDLFVNAIRENPYARLEHYSSLEEGSDQVRRLQNVKVRFGDVQPDAKVGYAAVTTKHNASPVGGLRPGRLFR